MLETAIKARLPLIVTRTDDLLNAPTVIQHIAGALTLPYTSYSGNQKNRVYVSFNGLHATPADHVYKQMVEGESCVVIVNPDEPIPAAFDVGMLPTPKSLVRSHLKECGLDDDAVMRCVSGLTLKQVVELVRLTQAAFGDVAPPHLMKMRARLMGQIPGLIQVETDIDLYLANIKLNDWINVNRPYFVDTERDPRLMPRGVLLAGPPGTGKTMGAKHIARSMGVPLYRLDLSSSLGKYVGESEANLSRVLAVVDQEEPCVLLIDEVEKVFQAKEDSGVTSRLLGQLLWWLQEHRSRVLVAMTTNDVDVLPPELYRAGRIDATIVIGRPDMNEALTLGFAVLDQFGITTKSKVKVIDDLIRAGFDQSSSHAKIVGMVRDTIKQKQWV